MALYESRELLAYTQQDARVTDDVVSDAKRAVVIKSGCARARVYLACVRE